jgi:hypothetical protein
LVSSQGTVSPSAGRLTCASLIGRSIRSFRHAVGGSCSPRWLWPAAVAASATLRASACWRAMAPWHGVHAPIEDDMAVLMHGGFLPGDGLVCAHRQSQQCRALLRLEDLERLLASGPMAALASDFDDPLVQVAIDVDDAFAVATFERVVLYVLDGRLDLPLLLRRRRWCRIDLEAIVLRQLPVASIQRASRVGDAEGGVNYGCFEVVRDDRVRHTTKRLERLIVKISKSPSADRKPLAQTDDGYARAPSRRPRLCAGARSKDPTVARHSRSRPGRSRPLPSRPGWRRLPAWNLVRAECAGRGV